MIFSLLSSVYFKGNGECQCQQPSPNSEITMGHLQFYWDLLKPPIENSSPGEKVSLGGRQEGIESEILMGLSLINSVSWM